MAITRRADIPCKVGVIVWHWQASLTHTHTNTHTGSVKPVSMEKLQEIVYQFEIHKAAQNHGTIICHDLAIKPSYENLVMTIIK